jgi:flagellar hook-length control protein FliK
MAALLPALVAGPEAPGAGSAMGGSAASAPDEDTKDDQTGTTANDPVGLLAMILGVALPVAGAAPGGSAAAGAGAGSASAVLPGASSGAGAGNSQALAAAADADSTSLFAASQGPGTGAASAALIAQLAASPNGAAPRSDGSDAQGTAGPPVQALSDLMRGLAPSPVPAASVQQSIAPAVGSTAWPGAVAAQVHWLASSGVSSATLNLSPEHLGPIQVYIDQQSSLVNVSFSAAHADTRAALEQALPKLREMFAAGGLALGQASVQQEARSGSQSAAPAAVTRVSDSTEGPSPPPVSQELGLVDEYA